MNMQDAPKQIGVNDIRTASHARTSYIVTAPRGLGWQELLADQQAWANVRSRLIPNDELLMVADDGTWRALFVVFDVSPESILIGKAWVATVTEEEFMDAPATGNAQQYTVRERGVRKWSVLRKDAGRWNVVKDGFATKQEAESACDAIRRGKAA